MKKLLIVTLILLVAATASFGYIRRAMYELFTSGTCGPCVSANDYLDDWYPLHHDEVCMVRYHTSWPGSGDIFYAANPTQNAGRTSFYGISAVPAAVVTGSVLGSWVGSGDVALATAGVYSPFEIELIPLDSGNVQITVLCEDSTYSGTLDLYVAFIEDSIYYVAPNGQTNFHEVMRYMLPDHNGEPIIFDGDTSIVLSYDFEPHIGMIEDYHNCWYVAWLQDQSGSVKEVHQCNKSHVDDMSEYGHLIDIGQQTYLIWPSDTATFNFQLTHFGYMNDSYDIWIETDAPAGWFVEFEVGGSTGDSTHLDLESLDIVEGELKVSPLGDPKTGHVYVYITPETDPEGGVDTLKFTVLAGGDLLYVVSSVASASKDYYIDLFEDNGVSYGVWDQAKNGHLPDYSDMRFDAVFWHDGYNTMDGMDATERVALRDYLMNGGKVCITSSGLGVALGSLPAFYMFILGAQYQGTEYGPAGVTGSGFPGTAFSELDLTLPGSGHNGEKFTLYGGESQGILRYDAGPTCGLKKDFTGGGKLVYIAFELEDVTDEAERDAFWDALLDYWGGLDVEDVEIPREKAIVTTSPNPFNSTANIEIELPRAADIAVEIYDISGRRVDVAYNGMLSAGLNNVRWEADDNPSGIYWIKIIGDYEAQSKALLIK